MSTYNTIVIGFDGSEYSEAAAIEASNWIRHAGGHGILVHGVYFDSEEFALMPSQIETRFETAKKAVTALRDKLAAEFKIDLSVEVRQGEPHEVVTNVAREREAGLIVLGTYGRTGLGRMIMGSVTSRVIHDAPCDVLVVKRPCTECTGEFSSILVPFDGSDQSRKALGRAIDLPHSNGGRDITSLYVIPRYEEMIGFFKTPAIQKKLYEEGWRIVGESGEVARQKGASIGSIVEEGSVVERIVSISSGLGNDLIVIGSHGWTGLDRALMGSTAERVIMNASVPVLVVR